MPHSRRRIEANLPYSVCIRAKETLPFTCHQLTKFILNCVLARTQRDNKIVLCHDIWEGSHCHIVAVAKDSQQFTNFCCEVQKKVTDIIKILLGKERLSIFEGYPTISELGDLPTATKQIAYLYSNPAQDNVAHSIETFPGLSSYQEFKACFNSLSQKTQKLYSWIRLPTVKPLYHKTISLEQDRNLVKELRKENKKRHPLIRYPNAWMNCFGITEDKEVTRINQQIVDGIRQNEKKAALQRSTEEKSVIGVRRLLEQEILKPHQPKKYSRKVYVLCSDAERRKEIIRQFRHFNARCRECYLLWKAGETTVVWPPGAFRPPLPPCANAVWI